MAGTVITQQGINLRAKAEAGATLEFSRIAMGDGTLGAAQTLLELTALLNERMEIAIQSVEVVADGTVQVMGLLDNSDVSEGFYIREIGLFANDPDEGEILYSVIYLGDQCDYMPPSSSEQAVAENIYLVTVIGNATEVTAVFAEVASINVSVKRHFIAAATAEGVSSFVLPWAYNAGQPNLAVYLDGVKQVRGIHWDPPSGEEESAECYTVVFTTAVSSASVGVEVFSIPVAAGTYNISTVWHKNGNYTISNQNNNMVLTNRDCTAAIVFSLGSTISVGMRVTVAKLAAYDVTVQAPAGESIIDSIAGGYIQNTEDSQIGATLSLIKVSDTLWTVERGFGSWTTNDEE